ncbi:hypothetical protein DCAR_0622997 [Daucus carota subsp. sativus]|uniref:Uncharacterized protein n=1 Tax=Daucus carota subsp. sativus TaxID=79200 RepID=A0AAF0X992_DAUCS|nr:hypothetical protein DCAR_0622997 [Daucus carota subsp. sativus]
MINERRKTGFILGIRERVGNNRRTHIAAHDICFRCKHRPLLKRVSPDASIEAHDICFSCKHRPLLKRVFPDASTATAHIYEYNLKRQPTMWNLGIINLFELDCLFPKNYV